MAMGVIGEIPENLLRSAEGGLAVDDPVGRTGPCQEQVEGDGVGEHSLGEREPPLTPSFAQRARQQSAKATRENPDGRKKVDFAVERHCRP
jgi:hypothetical protein